MLEVSIFLDEDDVYEGKQMHEYILRYLMHHRIMGASAFEAMAGYGHKHHLNVPGRIGATDERPVMIVFIDQEEKVSVVLPHIREVVKGGLIVIKKAERV